MTSEKKLVYFFRHEDSDGCRKRNTTSHKKLPMCSTDVSTFEEVLEIVPERMCGASGAFFHGPLTPVPKITYTATHLTVDRNFKPVLQEEHMTEEKRTVQFVSKVKPIFNEQKIDVSMFGNMNQRFCPFMGGGNLSLRSMKCLAACVMYEDFGQDPSLSPHPEGQLRCGNIENKQLTLQTEEEVIVQLQANMMLCAVSDLTAKIKVDPMTEVKSFVCYGMVLCFPPLPILLLRLTIDFQSSNVSYERLFRSSSTYHLCLSADICLEYILNRLS